MSAGGPSSGSPPPGLIEVPDDGEVPASADAVVIGGGIVGVSAVWHLAQRGLKAVLIEKGAIGGEQSGRNWGWCRNTTRDPAEIPLMIQSMRDWRDPQVFGALDTGFRTTGIAYFTYPDTEAEQIRWLEAVRGGGLDSRMLSRREIDNLLPGNGGNAMGALYTPSDGCAEPECAAPAIAIDARRRGAGIHTHCAARGIETTAGRLSAVVTERGAIRTSLAILAGGIWSRLFLGNVGIGFPQIKVLGSVSAHTSLSGGPEISVAAKHYGWRKRRDGGYILSRANATYVDIVPDSFRLMGRYFPLLTRSIRELRFRVGRRFITEAMMPGRWALDAPSPFESIRIANPEPVASVLNGAKRAVDDEFPVFAQGRVERTWGGFIDVTPDALPAIGPLRGVPGLVLASGFSGHGFGLGPGGGRLAADIAMGLTPGVDAAPFVPQRFGL